MEVWVLDPKTLAVIDKQQVFDNQKLADATAGILDISEKGNREFLMSRTRRSSIPSSPAKVEVGEPKVVNPDDDRNKR